MLNSRIGLAVLLIIFVVAACYGLEYTAKERGLARATIVQMQTNNRAVAFLDVEALRKLDAAGPKLTTVLAAAGIDRYSGLEVKGLRSDAVYRLKKSDLNPGLQLVFTAQGTVNLCDKPANYAVLVQDVSEINAETEPGRN